MKNPKQEIETLARQRGVIRPKDLIPLGVHRWYLHQLVEEGRMNRSGRGLYTLAGFDVTEAHSLVEATRAQSNSVVCLLSALNFHQVGTQLPHQVWLALPRGSRISNKTPVPTRIVGMKSAAYEEGIESHSLEGVQVRIYNVAKTITDCFKFRSKVGLDVALEALREALLERRCTRDDLRKYAKINRVETVMTPYLQAMTP